MENTSIFTVAANSWVFLGIVTTVALLSRIALLNEPPIYDEYFHLLAADSWNRDRQLSILDGTYSRAALYTRMVGMSFGFFGDTSWASARVFPSLICGVALVPIVSFWTLLNVGRTAAIVCATFLIFWPVGIDASQAARFYSFQGLLFVVGALVLFSALGPVPRPLLQRIALFAISALLFFLALQIQLVTAVGLMGVAAWIAAFFVMPLALHSRRYLLLAVAAGAAAIAAFYAFDLDETVTKLWEIYRTAPPDWPRDTFYYHRNLRDSYPTFWPLFPVACLVAFARSPQIAAYCILVFGVSVVVLSFGIRNDMKYLYQSLPFFFIVWAIFFQVCFDRLWEFLSNQTKEASSVIVWPMLRSAVAGAAVVGVVGFAVMANAAFHRSARLVLGASDGKLFEEQRRAWPEAPGLIEPWIDRGALIITSHPVLATAYIGDFDVSFNRTHFHDNEKELSGAEQAAEPVFVIDRRDGRPVIADDSALMKLMRCVPVGVAVFPSPVRGSEFEHHFFVNARDLPIELVVDEGRNMALIGWQARGRLLSEECTDLPLPTDGGAAMRLRVGETGPVFGAPIAETRP